MSPQEQLNNLYIRLGEGEELTDELQKEIVRLEDLINPIPWWRKEPEPEQEEILCHPDCHGSGCWDCAAVRGGCPEDA